jgi:hypothetical protein
MVDLGANAPPVASVIFTNRAPVTTACWTPPAAWTAAGIASTCNTRAINNTLRVLDANNATVASLRLTSALNQTLTLNRATR